MSKFLWALALISLLYSCKSEDKTGVDPNSTSIQPLPAPDSGSVSQQSPVSSTSIQDIWVLDSVNNKAIDPVSFSRGTPYLDLNTNDSTLKGHTGCNSMDGFLKVTNEKIIIDKLIVANQVCRDKGFEKKFLKDLKSGNNTYKILNDKLYLDTGPSSVYIFRRIRR